MGSEYQLSKHGVSLFFTGKNFKLFFTGKNFKWKSDMADLGEVRKA